MVPQNSRVGAGTPTPNLGKRFSEQPKNSKKHINFKTISSSAVVVLPLLVERWFPHGRKEGREWVVGNLAGDPGRSLRIVLSGPKAGVWRDFAAGLGGADVISLAAAKFSLSQNAARQTS